MNRVYIQSAAIADIAEAAKRYEAHRSGLGIEFTLEIDVAIGRAAENPEMYEVKEQGARRALIRRFPYSVYFLFDGRVIEIFAVLHQYREPKVWQARLG